MDTTDGHTGRQDAHTDAHTARCLPRTYRSPAAQEQFHDRLVAALVGKVQGRHLGAARLRVEAPLRQVVPQEVPHDVDVAASAGVHDRRQREAVWLVHDLAVLVLARDEPWGSGDKIA